jgi:hypothetical protein
MHQSHLIQSIDTDVSAHKGVTIYALTPAMRGQRWRFYRAYLPKTVLQGGGAFACFLGFGALVRCL